MKDFFIEIYSEEIPARMQTSKLFNAIKKDFESLMINLKVCNTNYFFSPLRVTIHAQFPENITIEPEIIRGPKISGNDVAIDGFTKKYNIKKTDLTEKNGYFEYITKEKIVHTRDILKNRILEFITKIQSHWPSLMTWDSSKFQWIRPIRNITCVFNGDIIDFKIGNINSSNVIIGYKFKNNIEKKAVKSFKEYQDFLSKEGILFNNIDYNSRFYNIVRMIEDLVDRDVYIAKNEVVDDADILTEASNLCEKPSVIIGNIDSKFTTLPSKLITEVMKSHQKYIPLYSKGKLSDKFAIVCDVDNLSSNIKNSILSGNLSVLNARLYDALFFYNKDLSTSIDVFKSKIDKIIFHKDFGSMLDFVQKIKENASILIKNFTQTDVKINIEKLNNTVELLKYDLASEVVGEFPELQGYMGSVYFQDKNVFSDAIKYQYTLDKQMRWESHESNGTNVETLLIIFVNHITYVNTLLNCNEIPTSSRDPFGIRRIISFCVYCVKKLIGLDIAKFFNDINAHEYLNLNFFKSCEEIFPSRGCYNYWIKNGRDVNLMLEIIHKFNAINANLYLERAKFLLNRMKSFLQDEQLKAVNLSNKYGLILQCFDNNMEEAFKLANDFMDNTLIKCGGEEEAQNIYFIYTISEILITKFYLYD